MLNAAEDANVDDWLTPEDLLELLLVRNACQFLPLLLHGAFVLTGDELLVNELNFF